MYGHSVYACTSLSTYKCAHIHMHTHKHQYGYTYLWDDGI